MQQALRAIYRLITSYIDVSEKEWAQYSSAFQVKNFRKNEILLSTGDVCRSIYFVNKGLLRIFFVDGQAQEHTFHFSLEDTFATDYESFLKRAPATYAIQALENTEVVMMSYEMLHGGYATLQHGERLGRRLAEDHFFLFGNKIRSFYTESPLERYHSMNLLFPGILQRVPQHYIASYLHISSVHLSRLKNS